MIRQQSVFSFRGALRVLLALAITTGCDRSTPASDGGSTEDGGSDDRDASRVDGGDPGSDSGPTGADSGPPDAGREDPPLFRNAVDLPDAELATQALRLMGAPEAGGSGSCSTCHAITRPNIRHFWDISDAAWRTCFADLAPDTREEAQAVLACFRSSEGYSASQLGVFVTGGSFAWFQYVFRLALGGGWETEYESFRTRVLQPPDGHTTFTQAEFDLLTEWFLRGTPYVDSVLPVLDGPGECTPFVDASVAGIVAEGALSGWSARNAEATMLMHDCAGATDPLDCLSSYPRVGDTPIGVGWETPGTEQRLLFTVPYQSSYWTKTSADGRFVAHGGNNAGAGSSIIDLDRGVIVGVEAAYDPGFFPDGSGFIFQGTGRGTGVCQSSVLTTGAPTRITFSEAGCTAPRGVALYQHVGASLDGADYWIGTSLWSGDPGDASRDPEVYVDPGASARLHRLTNTASGFTLASSTEVDTPWQGNAVVSPTMRLMVTQLADASGAPLGFVLHRLDVSRSDTGAFTGVTSTEVARYCTPGGKAAMSLDDRWIVTHHRATDTDAVDLGFTGPSDPAFAAYRGVSNIYLIDVATGERTRITSVRPGQRALFPSFRSDGWIYFLVRSGASGSTPEYVVASNAGIVLR